jgi:hypothetical protein
MNGICASVAYLYGHIAANIAITKVIKASLDMTDTARPDISRQLDFE